MGRSRRWQMTAAIIGLSWLATLIIFRSTLAAMVATWQTATYSHGILILPIFLYMAWTYRSRIESLAPAPQAWGLPIVLLLGLVWLAGRMISVVLIEELALVAMLQALLWSLAGSRTGRILLFPLLFLFFAVPMGESLIAPLQDFTASFAVKALQLSGVPVLQEGRILTTASGLWQVAQACSGISFVISFAVLGCLYSFMMYSRWSRRLGFVAAALLMPVLANGLRVYAVIMLAHLGDSIPLLRSLSDATVEGWGHRLHGWIFFSLAALALAWIGLRWYEPQPGFTTAGVDIPAGYGLWRAASIAVASALLLLPLQLAADALSRRPAPDTFLAAASPRTWLPWSSVARPESWTPHFAGANQESLNSYAAGGAVVELYVAYYSSQTQGAELINSENQIADAREWNYFAEQVRSVTLDGKTMFVRETTLRSLAGKQRRIWQWYWVGGEFTSSPYVAKFLQAKARLLGGSPAAAAMTLSAVAADSGPDTALVLQDFLNHTAFIHTAN